MVNLQEAIDLMCDDNKLFRHSLVSLCDDWHPESPPGTIVFSEFGKTLAKSADTLAEGEIRSVLKMIEFLLSDGVQTVRDVVCTGFLESLLNAESRNEFNATAVFPWLGPRSRKYCVEWNHLTGSKTPGL